MLKVIAFGLISNLWLIGSIRTQNERHRYGVTARAKPLFSTSTRHQVALWNVGQGAANSLSAMPSSSDVRIETPQKPEPASDFLPPELRDQYENAGTYSIIASEGTTRQRVETPSMPETIAIRYVSNGGSDANDGVSWGTAKHTIYGALISLPGGGSNESGSGTVYVGPASAANPTTNAGIWLMGSADPNFGSPPAGWLKCSSCIVNIIGITNFNGGPNSHMNRVQLIGGSNADRNHPVLWFSALGQPVTIQNLQLGAGRGGVLGECSDHTRVNVCGAVSETFINDGFGVSQSATNGPALDITGYSYWLWFRDCGFSGNAVLAGGGYLADNAAGMLIDGTGNNGQGLIYVTDANFAAGGIKLRPGSLGVSSLYVTDAIEEGDFVHNMPPVVWFTAFGGSMDSYLLNLNLADSGGTNTVVQNDGGGPGPTVVNSYGSVVGPALLINPHNAAATVDPLFYSSGGIMNNYLVGNTNAARRIGGMTPTRFLNKANTNSGGWTVPNLTGVLTFTQGVTDPFGGTRAATASTNSGTTSFLQLGTCTAYTPVAGDWIVIGEWEQNVSPNNTTFIGTCYGWPFPTTTGGHQNKGMIAGDGNWEFLWTAYKVSGGVATNIGLGNQISSVFTPTVYGPVMYVIPAGTLSENEVIEFASTMNSVDTACPTGSICNVSGHPLVVDQYKTMTNCSSSASPAVCGSASSGSVAVPTGATPTLQVNTTAVTANSQIFLNIDESVGTKLGVTCNTTLATLVQPVVTARSAGTSFTIQINSTLTTNPACVSYLVVN